MQLFARKLRIDKLQEWIAVSDVIFVQKKKKDLYYHE